MSKPDLPSYRELLWPSIRAIRSLGGSASISEIDAEVQRQQHFTEEQRSILHGDGPSTEIEYRLRWARTYLKGMRLLANPTRRSEMGRTHG
ncbi:hypothetical protein C1I98_26155 [Spongiactinospora gelatinilytica]|uniref:Restriction system protein Mrr-like N-terminal domain-containing protein n=1 Tax=Spongiactinospora gelatinilytica TaxID=2666298 RepID=A0A2W2GHR3_9ACTN|nr:hypothetical protein C1I98_26155 [Spongiactinospora gelatinilytica]